MPITSHGHFPAKLLSSPFHKAVNQHHYAYQLPRKTSSAHSPGEQDQNVFVSSNPYPTPATLISNRKLATHKTQVSQAKPLSFLTFHHLHLPILEEGSSHPLIKNRVPSKTWLYSSPKPSGLTANSFFLCYKHASHLKTASFTFTSNYLFFVS